MTDLTQGKTAWRVERTSSPLSLRRLRYSISPAEPRAIHRSKRARSSRVVSDSDSGIGATAASANPACCAREFTRDEESGRDIADAFMIAGTGRPGPRASRTEWTDPTSLEGFAAESSRVNGISLKGADRMKASIEKQA